MSNTNPPAIVFKIEPLPQNGWATTLWVWEVYDQLVGPDAAEHGKMLNTQVGYWNFVASGREGTEAAARRKAEARAQQHYNQVHAKLVWEATHKTRVYRFHPVDASVPE